MNKESLIIKMIMVWALIIIFNMIIYRTTLDFKLNRIHDDIKELKVYIEEIENE